MFDQSVRGVLVAAVVSRPSRSLHRPGRAHRADAGATDSKESRPGRRSERSPMATTPRAPCHARRAGGASPRWPSSRFSRMAASRSRSRAGCDEVHRQRRPRELRTPLAANLQELSRGAPRRRHRGRYRRPTSRSGTRPSAWSGWPASLDALAEGDAGDRARRRCRTLDLAAAIRRPPRWRSCPRAGRSDHPRSTRGRSRYPCPPGATRTIWPRCLANLLQNAVRYTPRWRLRDRLARNARSGRACWSA